MLVLIKIVIFSSILQKINIVEQQSFKKRINFSKIFLHFF